MSEASGNYHHVDLKALNGIPMLSITDIKASPMKGFRQAKRHGTGVYITNRSKIVGVMLTQSQYEDLVHELHALRAKTRDML